MFKKRYFSVNNDFKTGLYFKFFLFLGILFSAIYIFFKISSYITGKNSLDFALELYKFSQTNILNSTLAFCIIFYAIAVIFYYFNYQFSKLAKIADEIENSEDLNELENTENIEKIDNFENK